MGLADVGPANIDEEVGFQRAGRRRKARPAQEYKGEGGWSPGLGKGFEPEMVGEKENDFSFKEGDLLV